MTDDRLKTGGALDALPDSAEKLVANLRGRILSGYRIGDLIGSGGMGYVLKAARAEGDFEREAAVKVVPASLGSSAMADRFRTEVQILARLNHPAIAQLYDAGQTEEGWPYLVMEYVDGKPIDEYCAANDLDIDERVDLLIKVARAVRFAHARLIVHRDLKPSNVLVDAEGRPKLLDFGIAKLLEPGTPEHTVGHRPMTPQYASPEQLLGADITTGSDIYQLGILALAVIAEETPLESATLQEAIRNAAAGNDRKISERAARQVPKDLLAIITRCLHSDPEDRYTDVNALLRDLDSYRSGHPVSARKGSRLYRAKKLVHRNLPATAFALLAAMIAIGGTTYYTVDMNKARRLAEERAATASQTLTAMSSMIADTYSELIETRGQRIPGQATESQLQNEPLRLVMERTEKLIDSVVAEQSALRAELLYVQGMTNRELNRLDAAELQLEEALALMRDNADVPGEVAVLHEIMKLESMQDKVNAAQEILEDTIALMEGNSIAPALQAKVYTSAVKIESSLGNNERALDFAMRSIDILERSPAGPTTALAHAYSELGTVYGRLERSGPLREWLTRAVALYIELEGPSYRGLSAAYNGLALSHVISGEYDEAMDYLQRDLQVIQANFGERHMLMSKLLSNMGIVFRRKGEYHEALEHFSRAGEILDTLPGAYSGRRISLYLNIGNTYQNLGRIDAALASFERGLGVAAREDVPSYLRASLLNNSGDLLMVKGRLNSAIDRLERAIQQKIDVYGDDNISTARSMLLLTQAHIMNNSLAKVPPLLESAETIYLDTYGRDHRKLSFIELVTGQYRLAKGDYKGARKALVSAYRHRLEEYEPDNVIILSPLLALARTELATGSIDQARDWLEKASAGLEALQKSHPERVEARIIEAELLSAEGRYGEAREASEAATGLVNEFFPDRADWSKRLEAI